MGTGQEGEAEYAAKHRSLPVAFKFVRVYGYENAGTAPKGQPRTGEQRWGFPALPTISCPVLVSRWWQRTCDIICLLMVLHNLQYEEKLLCAPGHLPSTRSARGNTNCSALSQILLRWYPTIIPKMGEGLITMSQMGLADPRLKSNSMR